MNDLPLKSPLAARGDTALSPDARGMLLGLIGVAIFSLTLPMTRLAVTELPPAFVGVGRGFVAALLAALWLWRSGAALPPRAARLSLALVALGCIFGFPLLTSIAMRSLPASHGAVLAGILPLATAVFAVLRGRERPSAGFWIAALAGSALVAAFALRQGGGSLHTGDAIMLAAIVLCALGYAEGGRLALTLGGAQVIAWALVFSLPVLAPWTAALAWSNQAALAAAGTAPWGAFAYVSAMSMFVGFLFWYRGMAEGGVARVGQVQLVQPFLTLLGACALLGEPLEAPTLLFALAVIGIVALGRRMRIKR